MTDVPERVGKKRGGFASMSPERLAAVSSLGGKGAAPESRAFNNRDLAKKAARMGAKARWAKHRGDNRADGPEET